MHTEELIKLARPLLADLVRLDCYEHRSCYLWRDCPLYATRRFAGVVTLAQTLGLKRAAAHQPSGARSRTGRLRHHWLEPAAS